MRRKRWKRLKCSARELPRYVAKEEVLAVLCDCEIDLTTAQTHIISFFVFIHIIDRPNAASARAAVLHRHQSPR